MLVEVLKSKLSLKKYFCTPWFQSKIIDFFLKLHIFADFRTLCVEVALKNAQCIIASHEQSISFYYRAHSRRLRSEKKFHLGKPYSLSQWRKSMFLNCFWWWMDSPQRGLQNQELIWNPPDNYSLLGLASCTILLILCPLWSSDISHAKSINTLWPRIYKLLVEVITLVNLQVIFSLAYLLKGNCWNIWFEF